MGGRVNGELAVSRSIGDHSFRNSGVIPNPTLNKHMLKPTDRYLIIATDGVWDCLGDRDVEEIVKSKDQPSNRLAQEIVKNAIEKGSQDNITCIVVKL